MKLFSVAITQDSQQFQAQVPDLPSVIVVGESIADTIDKVRTAIIYHLQELSDNHQPLPEPEHIAIHLTNPKFAGQTWAIVSLDSLLFNSGQKDFTLHLPRLLLTKLQERIGHDEHDIKTFILQAIERELTST